MFSLLAFGVISGVTARENVGEKLVKPKETSHKLMKFAAACDPATASADLDVNNVRTKILNGGDMWWDLANPKYDKVLELQGRCYFFCCEIILV